jgi:hypothetical protein
MDAELAQLLKKAAVLAVPLLLAVMAWVLVIAPVLNSEEELGNEIDLAAQHLKRYQTLLGQQDSAKPEPKQPNQGVAVQDLFYDAPNPNAAAASLQQKIGSFIAANGGQMRTARVEIKQKVPGFQSFAVDAAFAVSTNGLVRILFELENLHPAVFIDSLSIHGGSPLLNAQGNKPQGNGQLTAEDPVLEVNLTVSALLLPKV